MQEQLPGATQDDSMDGIGRVASGTKTEQLPRCARAAVGIICLDVLHIHGCARAAMNL
jgi:hypothetical protein